MAEWLEALKAEVNAKPEGKAFTRNSLYAAGYRAHFGEKNVLMRAHAFAFLLGGIEKHLYPHDLIAGSVRGLFSTEIPEADAKADAELVEHVGRRWFWTNCDHFAPGYEDFLKKGVGGVLREINLSLRRHEKPEERDFLKAAGISMEAFSAYVSAYAEAAREQGREDVAETCDAVAYDAPKTFRQALQLTWFVHTVFYLEERYAMALGRMDQYLAPFYEEDLAAGRITAEEATELLANAFYKIREAWYFGGDNVCNVAIGGVKRDGSNALNDLSRCILEAVRRCNIPGPNLSARISQKTPDDFLDDCLKVIGTGLGYPALMNDEVNVAALRRNGYPIEECRDYCMVGCIENFLPGKQPPWSDGRFNTPKYLELALNNGVCMLTGRRLGPATGEAESLDSMEKLLAAFTEQMRYGAAEYVFRFDTENDRYNPLNYQSPFLSCFCADCIGRAKDINNGGALYPSVHGAGLMGIATVADSLAAVEQVVYREKKMTPARLREALLKNFEGFEQERAWLLAAPKYGNDCPETDKYAVWFVEIQNELFSAYHTRDGGAYYIGIASNVQNISAGKEVAATPDGRGAREPLSDAASPMRGRDRKGPTAAVNSLTRPDYTKVSLGTVVNQKYSPEMFTNPEKRAKLAAILRSYFERGGQEMQINSVSRGVLLDAREHPENYGGLVVRVSGFSAYYTLLDPEVQQDILNRTEQG